MRLCAECGNQFKVPRLGQHDRFCARKCRDAWNYRKSRPIGPCHHTLEPDKFLFVECDGHDFHERTKEQAEHDRSKDRAIQAAGIPILRFTGREIWRDPVMVALEIFNFILSRGKDGT